MIKVLILLILISCQMTSEPVLVCKEVKTILKCNQYSNRCEVEFLDKTRGFAESPELSQMCKIENTSISKYSVDTYYDSSIVQKHYKDLIKERQDLQRKQSLMYIHAYH